MRDRLSEFGDANVAVVTFAAQHRLAAYRRHLDLPFPIVADPELQLYHLLGAGRGNRRQVWSPGTLRMYAGLLARGRKLAKPTEDIHQMGADAVVGRDGRLRHLTLPMSPDARPPIDDLIAALD